VSQRLTDDPPGYPRPRERLDRKTVLAIVAMGVAVIVIANDFTALSVALPAIEKDFHSELGTVQWTVNAYALVFGVLIVTGGRLADMFGRKRMFFVGTAIFALFSFLSGLAPSDLWLIAFRALMGIGGALMWPAILGMTYSALPPSRAGLAGGLILGAAGFGNAVGPLVGGLLTDLLSWRWILFINVPIGLVAAVLAQRLIAEGRNPERARSFDLMGALAGTLGLSILVLGIVRTDVTGWGSAQTLALLGAGVALLLLFVGIEGRFAKEPLMPLRIYASRTLSASNVVMLLVGGATFGMWFFLSLYLQQVLGYSPIRAGLSFLPMTLSIVVGSMLASRAVTRVGAKPLLVTGLVAQTLGLFLFTGLAANGSYLGDVLAPSLLVAIGIGLSFVPLTISAVAGVAPREAGLASGLVNTSRLVGGALGLAILAAIAAARTSSDLRHQVAGVHALHAALTSGFQLAFVVAAGFALVGCIVAAVGLPRIPVQSAVPAAEPPEPRMIEALESVVLEGVR
jgi:EmrB/QacA subfamily drug resistance transporter